MTSSRHGGRRYLPIAFTEQGGKERSEYGKQVIETLSQQLTKQYGKGFSPTNLKYFRLFFQAYPCRLNVIRHPAGDELAGNIKTLPDRKRVTGRSELSCGSQRICPLLFSLEFYSRDTGTPYTGYSVQLADGDDCLKIIVFGIAKCDTIPKASWRQEMI